MNHIRWKDNAGRWFWYSFTMKTYGPIRLGFFSRATLPRVWRRKKTLESPFEKFENNLSRLNSLAFLFSLFFIASIRWKPIVTLNLFFSRETEIKATASMYLHHFRILRQESIIIPFGKRHFFVVKAYLIYIENKIKRNKNPLLQSKNSMIARRSTSPALFKTFLGNLFLFRKKIF